MKRIPAVLLVLAMAACFGGLSCMANGQAESKTATKETPKLEDHGIKPDGPKDTPPKDIGDVKPWGEAPGKTFEARAAFTVTIEKLDKPDAKGETFGYFFGGAATPQSDDALHTALLKYAKFRHEKNGYPGWLEKEGYSENVVAVRCDLAAPWTLVESVVASVYSANMYRISIAPRDAFDKSDYAAGKDTRPLLTKLGEPYHRCKWHEPGVVSVPKEQVTIYARRENEMTEFITALGARGRRVVPGSRTTIAAITPELAADEKGKAKAKEARAGLVTRIAQAVEEQITNSGANIEVVELVGPGIAMVGAAQPIAPEFGFAFVCIDAIKQVNAHRKAAGKTELELRLKDPAPLPPAPEIKPESEVEYPKDEPMPEDPEDDK